MAQQIIFSVLALVIVVFSILAVTSKQIIRSATYLLFVLIGTAGLYLLLDYPFLFATQIAVYAGGVMVLFIFAILLTHKPGEPVKPEKKLQRVVSAVSVFVGLAFSAHIIIRNVSKMITTVSQVAEPQQIGRTLMGMGKYQYLLPFELVSVLLLASIVGAILIARKR